MTQLTKTTDREGKYLTFYLSKEEYGIRALNVREIIGMTTITAMPQVPAYVKGVINLRGKIIPVVDLRLKFGLKETEYTDKACIIIVDLKSNNGGMPMGVVVDAVSEVLNIKATDIENTPAVGFSIKPDFILGMAKAGCGIKLLLDIDKVLSTQEDKSNDTN